MSNHEIAKPDLRKARKLFVSYSLGFVLSLILVLLAFRLVIQEPVLSHKLVYTSLTVLMILHLLVQSIFFFRLSTETDDDRWNFLIFVFSLLIMLIVVSGSLWIMYNLNYNMVN